MTTGTAVAAFRVEVLAEGTWTSNLMLYGSLREAWDAGDSLMSRWFLPTDMRVMRGEDPVPWAVYSCSQCAPYVAGGMAPGHRGSTSCRSGSLASGGDRAHCTCGDGCWD